MSGFRQDAFVRLRADRKTRYSILNSQSATPNGEVQIADIYVDRANVKHHSLHGAHCALGTSVCPGHTE